MDYEKFTIQEGEKNKAQEWLDSFCGNHYRIERDYPNHSLVEYVNRKGYGAGNGETIIRFENGECFMYYEDTLDIAPEIFKRMQPDYEDLSLVTKFSDKRADKECCGTTTESPISKMNEERRSELGR